MAQKGRSTPTAAATPPSVPPTTGIELLKKLIGKATDLKTKRDLQESDVEAWRTIARDHLVRTFGSESPNVNAALHASGDSGLYGDMGDEEYSDYLRDGLDNKVKILESCIEQLQTDIELQSPQIGDTRGRAPTATMGSTNKVFIVHGHEHGIKEAVARFLERLNLEPIVLHERPNAGRTIIEKFSDYAEVQFAVVLLTGDDEAKVRGATTELVPRARQNVILELGYFLGRLGRARVCALYQHGVEIPSDYQGVLFIPIDDGDQWKFGLVRELRAAGFAVDANRIFSAD
jgi:predicted nucleotide-binding protein